MEIFFNKNFYKLPAIKKAIEAYRNLADFKIKNNGKSYSVVLDRTDPEAETMIGDEFSNYVLAATKNGQ